MRTMNERVRHWVVAGIAALVATVWVVMTLIVPSQAETARAAEASFNVQLAGSQYAPHVQAVSIEELPKMQGYQSFRKGQLIAEVSEEQADYLGRRLPRWFADLIRTADFLKIRDKFLGQKTTGAQVTYADGSKGFCIEPNIPGATGNLGFGTVNFLNSANMPHQAKAEAGDQGYLPMLVSEDQERRLKALAALYNQNPNAFTPLQWQGAVWTLGTFYKLTIPKPADSAAVAKIVAQAEAEAAQFQTNAELLKSVKIVIVDGQAGHKLVKLEGSEQAKQAIRDSVQGMKSEIKVSVNGRSVSGTVAQALDGGIDVPVACEGSGNVKVIADWQGAMSLQGTFAMQVTGRDQIKFIPSKRDVQVKGRSEVEVPCTPTTPEKPSTPTTPDKPETPVTPEKPSTPATPEKPSTPTTPDKPVKPAEGSLIIGKKVLASQGIKVPTSYVFTYACGDAPAAETTVAANRTTRIDGLAAGSTCVVREKDAPVVGADHALTWTINGAVPSSDAQVDGGVKVVVGEDSEVSVEATNSYIVPVGKVNVTKKLAGDAAPADRTFSFPYACATGEGADTLVSEGTLSIKGGEAAEIADVPAGAKCAIAETDAQVEGTQLATSWAVGGKAAQARELTWGGKKLVGAILTTPVAKGTAAQVTATNTYTEEGRGGFVVAKHVTGVDASALGDSRFAFDYSCQAGDKPAVTGRFQIAANEQFSSLERGVKLAKGSVCTVTERPVSTPEGVVFNGVTFNRTSGAGQFTSDKAKSRVTFGIGTDPVTFDAVNSFTPNKPVKPEAQTILATVNGGKSIDANTAKGVVTLVDTIRYTNLVAGKKYVADGRLMSAAGKSVDVAARAEFMPEAKNGTVEVRFEVPASVLAANTKLVAFEKIWEADKVKLGVPVVPTNPADKPVAEHEELDDGDQTVTITPPSPKPQKVAFGVTKVVEGADAADRQFSFTLACEGDEARNINVSASKRVAVEATAGAACTLTENNAAINGVEPVITFAGRGLDVTSNGAVASFKAPAAGSESTVEVIAKNAYPTPEAPKPEIGTTATNVNAGEGDNGKTVSVGRDAVIRDVMRWKNLPAGDYMLVPSLKRNNDGQAESVADVKTTPVAFTVVKDETEGQVVAQLTVPAAEVVPGGAYVVFERVYRAEDVTSNGVGASAVPVVSHEDINDEGQTVTTVTPAPAPATVTLEKIARDAAGAPVDAEFVFDLTCTLNQDTVEKKGLKVRQGERTAAIEVPAGATCVVSEDVQAATVKGKRPTLTFATNDAAVQVAEKDLSGTFTVPGGEGVALVVKATNTYPEWVVPPFPGDPGTPATPETPEKPSTPVTPGKPSTPVTPGKPHTPVTPDKPHTPATPDTPGIPDKPNTPVTPEDPCGPTPPNPDKPGKPGKPATPSTPDKPGVPDKPGEPGTPSTPDKPNRPDWCEPKIRTEARNGYDRTKTIRSREIATVVDTVSWQGLAPGDYVVNGILVDKTTGIPVAGQVQQAVGRIQVAEYRQSGAVDMVVTVPAGVLRPGHSYVMFERVHRAEDADGHGQPKRDVEGVEAAPVVTHADIDDPAQTVVVEKPVTPDKPHTPVTPEKPFTPVTPVTPDNPCEVPPVPVKPGEPIEPGKPGLPGEPIEPGKPGLPGEPATPGTPQSPDQPSIPGVPEECVPGLSTFAVDGVDGDKVFAPGQDALVRDQVSYSNFAAGEYVIVGSLMDKSTGAVVPGSHMVAPGVVSVGSDYGSGSVNVEFVVPGSVVLPGASWVVFERAYRVGDVSSDGVVREGAVPVVVHEDLGDADQSVSVGVPVLPNDGGKVVPRRPGVVVPPRGVVTPPVRGLARTGVEAGVVAAIGASVVLAGLGLVALRRRQDA